MGKIAVYRQPLGKPTKYRQEYAEQLLQYFEAPAFPKWEKDPKTGERGLTGGHFPTLSGFAVLVGCGQQVLRHWAEAKDFDDEPLYPEWRHAYYMAKEYQEQYLVEGYTSGVYLNPQFGNLLARNILGWREKTEIEQTTTLRASIEARVVHEVPGLVDRFHAFNSARVIDAEEVPKAIE